MRNEIKMLISAISPFDPLEKEQIEDAAAWIESDVEIFRIEKPDVPPKHLVSYFVLVDDEKLLLIEHLKAGLWLPPGGHVEKNEHPAETVKREIQEELGTTAEFISHKPFFITINKTVNIDAGHTDVSLWFLLEGDSSVEFNFSEDEMSSYKWFALDEILKTDISNFNPYMHRFVKKLRKELR